MATLTRKTKDKEALSNPFKLPRGEKLRQEIRQVFRLQRQRILAYLRTGRKDQTDVKLPYHFPAWHDFGLGLLEISQRFTPLLALTWDQAAGKFAPKVGLDPNLWQVINPHTERMINEAALAFSDSMNQTTSMALDRALARTREELVSGIVDHGEALPKLTERINAIFEGAETWRARRIAWTETSRAVHAAQEQAAIASGVVTGWQWLLSGDACPICIKIAHSAPAVRLGHAFAVVGDNPHYSQVRMPPLHPHCNCSALEILDTDPQPQWHDTLHQPEPATPEEHAEIAPRMMDLVNEVLGPKPARKKPARAPKPKPAPAKKPKPAPPREFSEVGKLPSPDDQQKMRDWSVEHFQSWYDGLSPLEQNALQRYTFNSFRGMNRLLRFGPESIAEVFPGREEEYTDLNAYLTRALSKASMPEPVIAYRGISDMGAIFGPNPKVGAVAIDKGFMSLSQNYGVAYRFESGQPNAATIKVTIPRGAHVASVSVAKHNVSTTDLEHELITTPGHGLRITKIDKANKVIHAELIAPESVKGFVKVKGEGWRLEGKSPSDPTTHDPPPTTDDDRFVIHPGEMVLLR
jgi:hypothetical protein